MAHPNNVAISNAWRALEHFNEAEGWRSIPILTNANYSLHAGRRYPENLEGILVEFKSLVIPVASTVINATGFELEVIDIGNKNKWLALFRRHEGSQELFAQIVTDIFEFLTRNKEKDEIHIYQLVIDRLHTWQRFMLKSKETLDSTAELGLVGELCFLELMLDEGVPLHIALDAWKGPLHGLKDFEIGTGAVEVKSTLATGGFPVHIMSLEQLDDSELSPLFLCGFRFSTASNGMTLPQRVDALRQRINIDNYALSRFNTSLLFSGYIDTHIEYYVRKFVNLDVRVWLVDLSFPRLFPGNVAMEIRKAQYELDLEKLYNQDVKLIEVLTKLGVF
jgi:hypothetical protein